MIPSRTPRTIGEIPGAAHGLFKRLGEAAEMRTNPRQFFGLTDPAKATPNRLGKARFMQRRRFPLRCLLPWW